ncbi:MAG TPA: winged helix-turn-helix transcriptional regulator [Gaiellaceae bacterium]
MSIEDLIALCHHRWSAPVLAELERQKGSRFVTLANTLGVGRESLKRTLTALIDLGLVSRNPGYGHPLRAEYVLTPRGRPVAARCVKLLAALNGTADVALRKWSLPVLAALRRPSRFSELRAELPGVTARALAFALKDLQAVGLVRRLVDDETYPPTVVYAATGAARRLRRALP